MILFYAVRKCGMLLLICKNFRKKIRSKYRRANPKNPVFSILRRFKMHNCFRFVFVFNCVFNLCTCSLLHEINLVPRLFLRERKDPGRSWSRATQILGDKLKKHLGRGGRVLRLENYNLCA